MKKYVIIIVISMLNLFSIAFANNAKVVLDGIKVNGIALQDINSESLVFAEQDNIEIIYHLQTEIEEKAPFRFLTTLKYQDQEYSTPTNITSKFYSNLKENAYQLTVAALDPSNKLNAAPLLLSFRVNNMEVKLRKELTAIQNKISKADSIIANAKPQEAIPTADGGLNYITIFSSLLGGMLIAIIGIFAKNKLLNKNIRTTTMDEQIDNKAVEALEKENADLKKEIEALRTQIDNLNNRSQELVAQNKELKEKADKLSSFNTELEELQKQKDDLFAMVIHDIKNPAGLIKSLVELLNSYDLSAVEQKEIIEDIVTTTNKIVTLSQEVTKILALESSAMHLNLDDYDISEIVKDVTKRNSIAANNKQIEILTEYKDTPFIPIDAQKVDEIVDNLLSNAIKFSPKGGKIKVAIKKAGDFVEVSVKDNGLGLSQEDISKAFQRGVKLSASPTANEHSSGFGLWIVKKLVEAHKGRVKITSALGKGSTFTVMFPLVQEQV